MTPFPGSPQRAGFPQRVVGRDKALSRMRSWLEKMLAGERQIVFVTGEAGIGKTALVDTFARSIASDRSIRIGRGQCLEQYGTGEAYLPVLEAIGRLCREQQQVVDVLRAHAPMWLLQMPSLVSASDRELLSREVSWSDTRANAARDGRGSGGADGRPAAGAHPGRPSLERLLDTGSDLIPGKTASGRSADVDWDLSDLSS